MKLHIIGCVGALALAAAACGKPVPAHAPYDSEQERQAVLRRFDPFCMARVGYDYRPCAAVIRFQRLGGHELYGLVLGVDRTRVHVRWGHALPDQFDHVALETTEMPGRIVQIERLASPAGQRLLAEYERGRVPPPTK
ncbi:MAG TPA: hypothetical protein VEA36_00115 [Candidatus Paceibacterota bacterium]|nr:hypothetical protein [Candidatus Paceibacterota bacterium]